MISSFCAHMTFSLREVPRVILNALGFCGPYRKGQEEYRLISGLVFHLRAGFVLGWSSPHSTHSFIRLLRCFSMARAARRLRGGRRRRPPGGAHARRAALGSLVRQISAVLSCHGIRQTLQGSFSAVSKPNFASKYAFESSRRDLHNALLCTAFGIHNRKLGKKGPGQNNPEKVKTRGH